MKKLAIFFPGIGYHADKPLLYYSRKLAGEAGYEQIALKYDYQAGNIRGNKEKMEAAFHALYAQAEEQLAEVDFTPYAEVLFVSKSVGTIIASAYAKKREWQQIFDISYTRRLRQPTPSHRSMRLHLSERLIRGVMCLR